VISGDRFVKSYVLEHLSQSYALVCMHCATVVFQSYCIPLLCVYLCDIICVCVIYVVLLM
jgi:hypothetical protein